MPSVSLEWGQGVPSVDQRKARGADFYRFIAPAHGVYPEAVAEPARPAAPPRRVAVYRPGNARQRCKIASIWRIEISRASRLIAVADDLRQQVDVVRSEERRVGKECRCRWSP